MNDARSTILALFALMVDATRAPARDWPTRLAWLDHAAAIEAQAWAIWRDLRKSNGRPAPLCDMIRSFER